MEFKAELQDVVEYLGLIHVDPNSLSEHQMINLKEVIEEEIRVLTSNLPHEEVHWVISDGLPTITHLFKALRYLELALNPPEPVEEPELSPQEILQDYGTWVGHCLVAEGGAVFPLDYVEASLEHGNITRKQIEVFLGGFYTQETTERMVRNLYGE